MATAPEKSSASMRTHVCCLRCRLRFTAAASAYITTCPECDGSLQQTPLESSLGFRRFAAEDVPHALPEAVAVSLPIPET